MTLQQPNYDVVIVGAGPAGTTTAKTLLDLRPETRVLLVDKAPQFPRDKPCGGYVGADVINKFPYLQNQEGHFVESETRLGILHSPDLRYKVEGRARLFAVLRSTFDAYLLGMAHQTGAQIVTNRQLTDIQVHKDEVEMTFADTGRITARAVVGADGATSTVARRTGLHVRWRTHQIVRTVVKEYPVDPDFILDQFGPDRPVHLFLKFNQSPGYAWVFPKANHINVGLGVLANYPIKVIDYFLLFIRLLQKWKMLPDNVTAKDLSAAIVPTAGPIQRTQMDRVVLVGDAAGFVSPITGAGIVPGMVSGSLAGQTLVEALNHQRFDEPFLRRYQIRWEKQIGRFERELLIQRIFLTRFLDLFIRIGERDAKIREIIAAGQALDASSTLGQEINVVHLLIRLFWALLKGPVGQL